MDRFEHGGDVCAHPGAVDFSANLNPLGMPSEVARALREHIGDFEAYPDPGCRELVSQIARALDVPSGWVLATAGATDLMSRVCLALRPRRALVTAPCYSGYEQALEQAGAKPVRFQLREDEGFGLGPGFVERIDGPGGLVIVASPNNPTGLTVPLPFLEQVAERAQERGAIVLLDECFADFADAPSAVSLCGRYPGLVVMRAFTKTYAMAGLRLGYGVCSDAGLLARIAAAGQPWAVSAPAQVAGLAALRAREAGYVEKSKLYVTREREWLVGELARLGYRVVRGEANYLLFDAHSTGLYERMLARGFLVRRCGNYVGLGDTWYRIAVRTREENERLVRALGETSGPSGPYEGHERIGGGS